MRGREDIALDIDIDNLSLDIDAAIPCALIANELVANALKHAYRGREWDGSPYPCAGATGRPPS